MLNWLRISGNRLTGRIPPDLGGLYYLLGLFLQDNSLTGEIPPELGNLYNLQWLRLHGNRLTGAIPAALADPAGLLGVSLADNRFSGCIPVSLRVVGQNDFSDAALPYCDLGSHCFNGAAADEQQQSTGLVEDCAAHAAGRGGLAGDSRSGLQSSVFGYWRWLICV